MHDPPLSNRTGSVCDIRRSNVAGKASETAASSAKMHASPNISSGSSNGSSNPMSQSVNPTESINKQRDVRRQMSQLDDLLRAPVPDTPPETSEAYSLLRGRYATLRAFERKLLRLCKEAEERCQLNQKQIQTLDDKFPIYQHQFIDNYRRALREVGKKPEDIPFMKYFEASTVQ